MLASLPAAPVLDRVAAVMNGETVTLSELQERAGLEWRRAEDMRPGEVRDAARARALQLAFDQIVAERLFAAAAKELGVEAGDAQVDAAIDDIKRKNRLDDERFDRALEEQGFDRESFRRSLKRDLETMQILNIKVKTRVKATDQDVQNYYQSHQKEFYGPDRVRARHIFLPLPQGSSAADDGAARMRGAEVLRRLAAGEDFAAVAREVSRGPSAADGGDLGFLKRGSIQAELEQAAFSLEPGQVSGLVKTRSGYHILKVEERRGGGAQPLDEVREIIRDRLVSEQVETYRTQYIAELRKEAVIEVRIPELKP